MLLANGQQIIPQFSTITALLVQLCMLARYGIIESQDLYKTNPDVDGKIACYYACNEYHHILVLLIFQIMQQQDFIFKVDLKH